MSKQIELSVQELQDMLNAQLESVAGYITRNLTVYSHFQKSMQDVDIDKLKAELRDEVKKSPYPNDFIVLKKYLKQ